MRKAPKWRNWVPTSRQLRFKLQSSLASSFPSIGDHFNFFPDNANPNIAPNTHLHTVDECSERDLPQELQAFFARHGALEQSRYPLPITPTGHTRFDLYKLNDALVLGSTGATVLKAQSRQIEAAASNTMRFSVLKDRQIDTTAINMLGMAAGHRHYYHFLCDVAYPLLFLLEALEPREFSLTLLLRENLPKFQEDFYLHLTHSFPQLSLKPVRQNERVHCKTLFHCMAALNCEYRAPASEYAAATVSSHYFMAYDITPDKTPDRKLYIARDDAKTRRILNEKVLIEQLEARGFESIQPGSLSHKEQVELFNSAKVVVGTHGAGLTNILFMQSGGKLVEVFPADYIQSAYAWLSHLRGLNYAAVIGEKSGSHQHFSLSQSAIGEILNHVDSLEFA